MKLKVIISFLFYYNVQATKCDAWTGLPKEVEQLKCGVLFYLHITKTGGSSVENLLRRQASGWYYTNVPATISELWINSSIHWDQLSTELMKDKPHLIITLHHGTGLGEFALENVVKPLKIEMQKRGCDLKLTTMLREPISKTKSGFFYLKGRAPVPVVTQDSLHYFTLKTQNAQTRYIIGSLKESEGMASGIDTYYKWVQAGRPKYERENIDRPKLTRALDILQQMDGVGRLEDFSQYSRFLATTLGLKHEWPVEHARKSHYTGYNITNEDVEYMREHNLLDLEMYSHFCKNSAEI